MKPLPQGDHSISRMCSLAGLNRAGYYRHWRASAPREEDMAVRDAIQHAALKNRLKQVTAPMFTLAFKTSFVGPRVEVRSSGDS